ncbi:MAG: sigma-70 family RNA polymerase sigma factor [Eubacteriaceae bacterium]|nr:sigma-70 family RNA polymerase sigma factor [Eubacteriaceae bacterium]
MLSLYLTLIDTEEDKIRFTRLYEQYRHLMFYIAQKILDDPNLSEDAVQEAFLRIAKNFHKVGDILCPETRNFAVIITRNIALSMASHRHNDMDMDTYIQTVSTEFTEDVFEVVSNKSLTECIMKLPEIYRDTLYLYHLYGYTFNEIANLLSVPVETTKKRAQRARVLLKEMLEKEGYHHE